MNTREGMRRLGLVAGVLGACSGAFLSYVQLQPLLGARAQYREFQSLVSSPAVQKKIESLNEVGPWSRFSPSDRLVSAEVNQRGIKAIYFIGVPTGARLVDDSAPEFVKGEPSTKKAHYSATDVSAIETADGRTVARTEPPGLWSFLLTPVFPVLGFLVPWGAIKTLTWIGTGFLQSQKPQPPRASK